MLDYRIRKPPGVSDGSPVAVLLHGRGSDMDDLQGFSRELPPGTTLVTPQAPHPGAHWGYGSGWAWYRYLGEDRVDGESLGQSLEALGLFLNGLPGILGFQPGPLILGGFSQGGTTSLAYGIRNPNRVDGIVVLSGFLIHEKILGSGPEDLGDAPVFWGHGTQDPAVPHRLAINGRKRLLEEGGRLESRDYPMGHWVSPEEMEDLRQWLIQAFPGSGETSWRPREA